MKRNVEIGRSMGREPCVIHLQEEALYNTKCQTCVWSGCYLNVSVHCIPPCGEIGPGIAKDQDQYIRVEQGNALIKMGNKRQKFDFDRSMCCGDAAFIPSSVWYHVINIGKLPLKLSCVSAPSLVKGC